MSPDNEGPSFRDRVTEFTLSTLDTLHEKKRDVERALKERDPRNKKAKAEFTNLGNALRPYLNGETLRAGLPPLLHYELSNGTQYTSTRSLIGEQLEQLPHGSLVHRGDIHSLQVFLPADWQLQEGQIATMITPDVFSKIDRNTHSLMRKVLQRNNLSEDTRYTLERALRGRLTTSSFAEDVSLRKALISYAPDLYLPSEWSPEQGQIEFLSPFGHALLKKRYYRGSVTKRLGEVTSSYDAAPVESGSLVLSWHGAAGPKTVQLWNDIKKWGGLYIMEKGKVGHEEGPEQPPTLTPSTHPR